MRGIIEHFLTVEIQVDYLEEEAREEFGRREANSWPSSFLLGGVLYTKRRAAGVQGRDGGGQGQEGRDKARAALWGPDGFLGALVVPVLSLILTQCDQVRFRSDLWGFVRECEEVYVHTSVNGVKGLGMRMGPDDGFRVFCICTQALSPGSTMGSGCMCGTL